MPFILLSQELEERNLTVMGSTIISDSLGNYVTIEMYDTNMYLVAQSPEGTVLGANMYISEGKKYIEVLAPENLPEYREFVNRPFKLMDVIGLITFDESKSNDYILCYEMHCSYTTLTEIIFYYIFTE